MKRIIGIMALLALAVLAGCQQEIGSIEWRCNLVNCTETVQLTGEQWAQQNCQITGQGTLCQVNLGNGQSQVVPLEQLNLSAITATQCVKYVCIEETPYRTADYELNITK